MNEMSNKGHSDKERPTIISSTDARGALGAKHVKTGDTMMPTLIIGLVLALIAVAIVAYVVWPIGGV